MTRVNLNNAGAYGFTLIELMVTLSVAAIFIAIAVPSYRAMINRNTVATHVNDFLADLNYARSEAITRGSPVRMCKSPDGVSCATDEAWQQGWLIYQDLNNNDTADAAEIIRVQAPLSGGVQIAANQRVSDNVDFDANGFAFTTAGTFAFCDADADESNATDVIIAPTGRVRSEQAADCDS